jgi:hypothetical protein
MTKEEIQNELVILTAEWDITDDRERVYDIECEIAELEYALSHNFPHMIGGNDCEDAFSGNPTNYDETIMDELPF